MAKTETTLTVLLASPSDVPEERAALEQVIDELNITWANSLHIRLDLIRWETHAYPGIADDSQAVINEEMPNDYDIFIGIFWTRLGTRTHRAESGTVEEYEMAYKRYRDNPDRLRIMFYFKTAPVSPLELDAEELFRVQRFRDQLGGQGALYGTFADLDEFKSLIRMHLSRQVQTWGKTWARKETEPNGQTRVATNDGRQSQLSTTPEEEEEGFLDLIENGLAYFKTGTGSLNRLTEATNELAAKIGQHAAKLQQLNTNRSSVTATKMLVNQAAEDMEAYAARLKVEIPLYSEAMSKGLNAYSKSATLLPDFNPENYGQLEESINMLEAMKSATQVAIDGTKKFRQSVSSTPPATTQYNRAKRHVLIMLDDLLAQIERTKNLIPQIQNTMREIIENSKKE